MLKLITSEGLSSALTTRDENLLLVCVSFVDLVKGLKPWKHRFDGLRLGVWCFWIVVVRAFVEIMDEADAAIVFGLMSEWKRRLVMELYDIV